MGERLGILRLGYFIVCALCLFEKRRPEKGKCPKTMAANILQVA